MRWLVRGLLALVAIVVVALGVVYGGSEWVIRRSHAVPVPNIVADRSPAGIAEGGRLAFAIGCRGCHGPQGNGVLLADVPNVVHVAPPALAPRVAQYSDAELARLIRYGIKRDGSAVFVMPIDGHSHLADADVAKIIGWLRTLKPSAADRSDTLTFGPIGRFAILTGQLSPEMREKVVAPATRPAETGSYIAGTVCAGCHALHEERKAHDDGRRVPPLVEVGPAYDTAAFHKLLRTGVGLSPRDLGLMARVSRGDLSHLTDAEIDAVHTYLKAEADKVPPK